MRPPLFVPKCAADETHAHITFSCRWICVKDDNFQARTMHSNKCMAITGDSFNFDESEFSTTSWDETHSTCMISWQIFTQLVITNVTDGSGNLAQLVAFDASQIGMAYNGIWQRYSSQLWSFHFYAYIYTISFEFSMCIFFENIDGSLGYPMFSWTPLDHQIRKKTYL